MTGHEIEPVDAPQPVEPVDEKEPVVYVSTAKPKPPLTEQEIEDAKKPTVLIVGAGIGGLTLAILLHKAKVPFLVFERSLQVKPLGSAMSLGCNVKAIFQQIGIYDQFQKIGKPVTSVATFNNEIKPRVFQDWTERIELYVPKERIFMGKKVMSFEQNKDGVMIRCSDNKTHHGDILVGCDGAYSGVRQHLYKTLKKKKELPKSDDMPLPFSTVCLVGQTTPLDPEQFPDLKKETSQFNSVYGKSNIYSFLTKNSSKENDSFRNSEWGPEAAEAMCKKVRDLRVPGGKDGHALTIGELIDNTPKELISKVMLEEKVFHTWHGGRTVLLGDSCHKLNPAGGAGALSAIHDAIALSNWISTLETKELSEIKQIFTEYYKERYPVVKENFERSQIFSKLPGKNLEAKLARATMKRMPKWLLKKIMVSMSVSRPQVSFLPLVEDKGQVKALYQASLQKTLAIIEQRKKTAASGAPVSSATPSSEPVPSVATV
ncbi:hypothetical protein BGZ81_003978 [Podila clonocystis]|nr:hypothetical protein BGZ81_003978 [Podila clonocystis]